MVTEVLYIMSVSVALMVEVASSVRSGESAVFPLIVGGVIAEGIYDSVAQVPRFAVLVGDGRSCVPRLLVIVCPSSYSEWSSFRDTSHINRYRFV